MQRFDSAGAAFRIVGQEIFAGRLEDQAKQWLKEHRKDRRVADAKIEQRRLRMGHAKRQHIIERNAPILRRINKQEARRSFNETEIKRLNEQQRRYR